jgi:8-hydroxy-5-deazaflavin:NADPH oxidoreductase
LKFIHIHLEKAVSPAGDGCRYAIPVCGDDQGAKDLVMRLVDIAGYDPYDAGGLETSWRQQGGQPAFCVLAERPELKVLLEDADKQALDTARIQAPELYVKKVLQMLAEQQVRADAMAAIRKGGKAVN